MARRNKLAPLPSLFQVGELVEIPYRQLFGRVRMTDGAVVWIVGVAWYSMTGEIKRCLPVTEHSYIEMFHVERVKKVENPELLELVLSVG